MKSCDDFTSSIKPVHRLSIIISVPLYATEEFGGSVLDSVSVFASSSGKYVSLRHAHPTHIDRVERPSKSN